MFWSSSPTAMTLISSLALINASTRGEVVVTHVLCFVDYEHSLAYPVRLNFARPYHIGSFLHHIGSVIKVPDSAEQVEAVLMESLYFNEVCSVAYQLHQSLFEFRSCSS